MRMKKTNVTRASIAVGIALVALVFSFSLLERPAVRQPAGYPQLVAVQDFPTSPDWCPPPAPALPDDTNLFASFANGSVYAGSPQSGETGVITRPPIRTIRDKDPSYSAVAVDTRFDEVILMDNNMWGLRVFNRLDNTEPDAPFTDPKRIISGPEGSVNGEEAPVRVIQGPKTPRG